MNQYTKIKKIQLLIPNRFFAKWSLDERVSILVGENGSGKTTILNCIYYLLSYENKLLEKEGVERMEVVLQNGDTISYKEFEQGRNKNKYLMFHNEQVPLNPAKTGNIQLLNTFDVPISDARKIGKKSPLLLTLQVLVYGDSTSEHLSFEKYQLRQLEYIHSQQKEEEQRIMKNTQTFFEVVNAFFKSSGKVIHYQNQALFFKQGNTKITLEQLSAGEKQLLIILIKVLLTDNKTFLFLMDEPEMSLDIEWQGILIDKMLEINPNMQLIIATHSPSIWGKWRDRVIFMEDITKIV